MPRGTKRSNWWNLLIEEGCFDRAKPFYKKAITRNERHSLKADLRKMRND